MQEEKIMTIKEINELINEEKKKNEEESFGPKLLYHYCCHV